jgi:uncharacterized protein (DUF305 family)
MGVKRSATTAIVAVATALMMTACGGAGDEVTSSVNGSGSATTSTGTGATSAQDEHNQPDLMFVQMMIPHHAQAIEMSDILLGKDGIDERVVALAEQIKAAQGPEIEQMKGWLEGWGEDVSDTGHSLMGGMGHFGTGALGGTGEIGGMMSQQDMNALQDAGGAAVARLFLQQMTQHHQGAIQMAKMEVASGQDREVIALAQTIIESQQAEIGKMQNLLASL